MDARACEGECEAAYFGGFVDSPDSLSSGCERALKFQVDGAPDARMHNYSLQPSPPRVDARAYFERVLGVVSRGLAEGGFNRGIPMVRLVPLVG